MPSDSTASVGITALQGVAYAATGDPGRFLVTRNGGDLNQPLTVSLDVGGTEDPSQYTMTDESTGAAVSDSVTIPAESDAAVIVVTPNRSADPYTSGTVIATITGDSDETYSINEPWGSATVNVVGAPLATSATLSDPAAALSVTASGGADGSDGGSTDLYVPATGIAADGSGSADLSLSAIYTTDNSYPNAQLERWAVLGGGGSIVSQGDFSTGGPSLQLWEEAGKETDYTVIVGTDLNGNGVLDSSGSGGSGGSSEVAETIDVHVEPMTLDILKDGGSNLDTFSKHTTGGYVLADDGNTGYQFDSSGNPIPDENQTGTNSYDDALRPIVMRADPGEMGGRYTLSFGGNIRLFMNADKSAGTDADGNSVTSIVSGQTQFDAGTDTKVWVEGLGVSSAQAAEQIRMNWMATPATPGFEAPPAGQPQVGPAVFADFGDFTVADIVGPGDVPDFAKYVYTINIPNQAVLAIGKWSATGGNVVSQVAPNGATVLWTQGPNVGKVAFTPLAGFKLEKDVNVVQVAFSAPTTPHLQAFAPGSLMDGPAAALSQPGGPLDGVQWKDIKAGTPVAGSEGMTWAEHVKFTGPLNDRNTSAACRR